MARTVRAGQLRESVYFERRGATDDGYGNTKSGDFARWYPVSGGIPAQIMPVRGGEDTIAQRLTGTVIYEITVRRDGTLGGLTEQDRCIDARTGAIYNIRAIVNPDMRGRFLALTCEKGVAT